MKISTEFIAKAKKVIDVATIVVFVLMTLLFGYAGYRVAYDGSKKTSQTATYWLPEHYRLVHDVKERPAWGTNIEYTTMSSLKAFTNAFGNQTIDVVPGGRAVVYITTVGNGTFISPDVGYKTQAIGSDIVKFDASKPGLVTMSLKRSWTQVCLATVLGAGVGAIIDAILYAVASMMVFISKLIRETICSHFDRHHNLNDPWTRV